MADFKQAYQAIVIGSSAGGLHALSSIFELLPADYPIPIMVVQHRSKDHNALLEEVLQAKCVIKIKQADEKEIISPGCVYIAPPDYHLLVEDNKTFSLSSDPPVHYSRPSVDVLFESAAQVYKKQLIGIVLTGANSDGAEGIIEIRKNGGVTIAQSLLDADFVYMPRAAIQTLQVVHVWTLKEISSYLLNLIR
ncbi:MAG TPA: chemotaxis protein CheB [Cytophagaceae bacterium]|nr:chemotaxis protein CheB [Cytophagaceae bacterium]